MITLEIVVESLGHDGDPCPSTLVSDETWPGGFGKPAKILTTSAHHPAVAHGHHALEAIDRAHRADAFQALTGHHGHFLTFRCL